MKRVWYIRKTEVYPVMVPKLFYVKVLALFALGRPNITSTILVWRQGGGWDVFFFFQKAAFSRLRPVGRPADRVVVSTETTLLVNMSLKQQQQCGHTHDVECSDRNNNSSGEDGQLRESLRHLTLPRLRPAAASVGRARTWVNIPGACNLQSVHRDLYRQTDPGSCLEMAGRGSLCPPQRHLRSATLVNIIFVQRVVSYVSSLESWSSPTCC